MMEIWNPKQREMIPWRPLRELEEIGKHFEDIFGRPSLPAMWKRFPIEERGWTPPVEIFEKDDKYVVKTELPGMKEEDIDVSVAGDMLTIKGERKSEKEVNETEYYCCERSYGSFLRSIALPSNVDSKKIEANYENGILEISLPKAAQIKTSKISVSVKNKEKAKKAAK